MLGKINTTIDTFNTESQESIVINTI